MARLSISGFVISVIGGSAPDFAAHVITGVAIVQGAAVGRASLAASLCKGVEGLQLVLGQGFEGKKIKRPGFRVQQMPSRTGKL